MTWNALLWSRVLVYQSNQINWGFFVLFEVWILVYIPKVAVKSDPPIVVSQKIHFLKKSYLTFFENLSFATLKSKCLSSSQKIKWSQSESNSCVFYLPSINLWKLLDPIIRGVYWFAKMELAHLNLLKRKVWVTSNSAQECHCSIQS